MPSATSRVASGFLKIMPSENVSFWTHAASGGAGVHGINVPSSVRQGRGRRHAGFHGVHVRYLLDALGHAIYHAEKRAEGGTSVWRKFESLRHLLYDSPGAYTPLSYYWLSAVCSLEPLVRSFVVALGVVFKLFWLRAPRWLYTSIYAVYGLDGCYSESLILWHKTGPLLFSFVVGGCVVYSIGALFYVTKKRCQSIRFHEIFHVLNVAAALQYAAIFLTVKGFAGA